MKVLFRYPPARLQPDASSGVRTGARSGFDVSKRLVVYLDPPLGICCLQTIRCVRHCKRNVCYSCIRDGVGLCECGECVGDRRAKVYKRLGGRESGV